MIHADFQEVVAKQVTILFSGSVGSLNPILIVPCSKNASLGQKHLLVNFWPFVVRNSLSSKVGNATDAIDHVSPSYLHHDTQRQER